MGGSRTEMENRSTKSAKQMRERENNVGKRRMALAEKGGKCKKA